MRSQSTDLDRVLQVWRWLLAVELVVACAPTGQLSAGVPVTSVSSANLYHLVSAMWESADTPLRAHAVATMTGTQYFQSILSGLTDEPIALDGTVVANMRSGFIRNEPYIKATFDKHPIAGFLSNQSSNHLTAQEFQDTLGFLTAWAEGHFEPERLSASAALELNEQSKVCARYTAMTSTWVGVLGAGCGLFQVFTGETGSVGMALKICAATGGLGYAALDSAQNMCSQKSQLDSAKAAVAQQKLTDGRLDTINGKIDKLLAASKAAEAPAADKPAASAPAPASEGPGD